MICTVIDSLNKNNNNNNNNNNNQIMLNNKIILLETITNSKTNQFIVDKMVLLKIIAEFTVKKATNHKNNYTIKISLLQLLK